MYIISYMGSYGSGQVVVTQLTLSHKFWLHEEEGGEMGDVVKVMR